jgi:hypothetical protein
MEQDEGQPTRTQQTKICDDCDKIELPRLITSYSLDRNQHIFAHDRREYDSGVFVSNLRTRCSTMPSNGCHLCVMFYNCRYLQGSWTDKEDTCYSLYMFSYVHFSPTFELASLSKKDSVILDIPFLAIIPDMLDLASYETLVRNETRKNGFLLGGSGRIGSSLGPFKPRVLEDQAEIQLVRQWIRHCDQSHPECKVDGEQVHGLKLIDCHTKQVVAAPSDAQYVALSYVWGDASNSTEACPERSSNSSIKFSRTIEDSIEVCNSLYYQYLWVDKYCIDQSNANETHQQINQMDMIYQNAALTIIASSGNDCNAGLPGVGDTRRPKHHVVELALPPFNGICSTHHIFKSGPHPRHIIPLSPWSSRAWTLQEAVLSRRRLVFTEHEMYFECLVMNCCERAAPDLTHLDLSFYNPGILSGNLRLMPGDLTSIHHYAPTQAYMNLVVQYSHRELRFPSDKLRAFIGIMRHFTRLQDDSVYQIWGISYPSSNPYHIFIGLSWIESSLDRQTLQDQNSHGKMSAIDLHSGPSFPSWSWLSVRGKVYYPDNGSLMHSRLHSVKVGTGRSVWIDIETYSLGFKEQFADNPTFKYDLQPRILLLDADIVLPSEIYFERAQDSDEVPMLFIHDHLVEVFLDSAKSHLFWVLLQQSKLEFIVLSGIFARIRLMIVMRRGASYTRVGLGLMTGRIEANDLDTTRKLIQLH